MPKWRTFSIPEMLASGTKVPIPALDQAVKAKDDPGLFATAYEQLTEARNICRRSADRGIIVIQPPQSSPFPNQDFRPAKE